MPQHSIQKMPRLLGDIIAVLLCAACFSSTQAEDYKYYRYGYPYRDYHPDKRYELRQDMNRLRAQINRQEKQLKAQIRLQQEQTRLLRQQASAQHRVTAMQACFYRFNAGLDLCEDLFDAASIEYAACLEKVMEKNPGCAEDIPRPAFSSKD